MRVEGVSLLAVLEWDVSLAVPLHHPEWEGDDVAVDVHCLPQEGLEGAGGVEVAQFGLLEPRSV